MIDPKVSASLFGGLLDMAVAKGPDRDMLIRCVGIMSDRDNRIPLGSYVVLFRAGKELAAIQFFA